MSVRSAFFFTLVASCLAGCAESSGQTCELNSDCLQGTCVDGECKRECADSELDCPIGYVCSALGRCEYAGTGAGTGGATSTGPGAGGGASTTGTGTTTTTTTTSGTSSTSTGMMMDFAELTLCSGDADCETGICREMTPGGESRCTRTCSSHAQCPAGLRCEDPGGGFVCVRGDVGRACASGPDCNFACLSPLNYCTSECSTGADCPNGYGCMPISNTNVCVRVAADCAADTSQCVAPAACDSSPNLVVSSCTMACNTAADCPQRALPLTPWTCDGAGVCRRPGDVYGPLPGGYAPAQWACNAASQVVNVCGDGLHIDFGSFTQPNPPAVNCNSPTTTDGLGGDACLDSCRLKGGCAFGFGCAGVAEIGGQRIGLCMKSGGGEVGAACNTHGDCVFGYCEANVCTRDCSKDDVCPEGSQCVAAGGPNIEGSAFKRCE